MLVAPRGGIVWPFSVLLVALPKAHRLRQRQDIDAVYKRGRRYGTSHVLLRALKLLGPKQASSSQRAGMPTRLAVAISTKVHKRAVVRNLIRRRIHAAFIELLPRVKPGWVLMLNVRPSMVECDYYQILQELEKLLTQAEVLHGHS